MDHQRIGTAFQDRKQFLFHAGGIFFVDQSPRTESDEGDTFRCFVIPVLSRPDRVRIVLHLPDIPQPVPCASLPGNIDLQAVAVQRMRLKYRIQMGNDAEPGIDLFDMFRADTVIFRQFKQIKLSAVFLTSNQS